MSTDFADPPHDPDDLALIIEHRLRLAVAEGRPPTNLAGWTRAVRKNEIENERLRQGWIEQAADGIRHAASTDSAKKLTGWRETRGSHSVDWVYDPTGTDRPPADGDYDIDKAKAEYKARRKLRSVS